MALGKLQFTSSVASRVSTVNLERQLLKLLFDKINLQRSLGKHRADYFTNFSRQFIYERMMLWFDESRGSMTKDRLEFEIEKRFDSARDKDRISDIWLEYDLIQKVEVTEDLDNIINALEDVQLGGKTEALLKESYKLLAEGRFEEAANMLKAKSVDLSGRREGGRVLSVHRDSADLFTELRNRKDFPERYAGIPTGFEKFDKLTGGLFPAELTVVFGLSGKGKSTFMKALACNIRRQGRVVLHCGNEENEFQMRLKYMSADSGFKYSPLKRGTFDEEEYAGLKKFSDEASRQGDIYVFEFPQQTDATLIERAYRELEMKGIKVDVIVVDYLDLMKPIAQAYSENDEQGKVTSDLKQLAINCNCPVVTATQAGTQSEKQEKKSNPFLTAADVFGTKRKVHSANTLIGIVNQTATAMANDLDIKDRKIHKMVLCVPKNRDGAVFTFRLKMDTECGRFYDDDDPDDPIMKSVEQQTMKMMDDTASPTEMKTAIDVDEIQDKVAEDLNEKILKLNQEVNGSSDSPVGESSGFEEVVAEESSSSEEPVAADDPLFGGNIPASPLPPAENTAPSGENNAPDPVKKDPFLNVEEKNEPEKIAEEAEPEPSPEPVVESSSSSETVIDDAGCDPNEPLTPFDDGAGRPDPEPAPAVDHHVPPPPPPPLPSADTPVADSIPHKKSFAELMRERRKKP